MIDIELHTNKKVEIKNKHCKKERSQSNNSCEFD